MIGSLLLQEGKPFTARKEGAYSERDGGVFWGVSIGLF